MLYMMWVPIQHSGITPLTSLSPIRVLAQKVLHSVCIAVRRLSGGQRSDKSIATTCQLSSLVIFVGPGRITYCPHLHVGPPHIKSYRTSPPCRSEP